MIRERRNGSGGNLFFTDGANVVDRWAGNGENAFADYNYNRRGCEYNGSTLAELLPVSSSSVWPPASPLQHKSTSQSGYIQHSVSKYDTLAGVAIRYGVEVADIRRLNGLVSDIQMFALKTLHIPLPGRHPPSSCLSNGSDASRDNSHPHTPTHRDPFDSFQSLRVKSSQQKASPAMNSLHGFYGINSSRDESRSQVLDMAGYKIEDEPDKGSSEKLVRRRQKSEADFTCAINSSSSPNNNSDSSCIQDKASMREDNGSPPTMSLRTSSSSSKMNGSGGGGLIPILMIGIGDSFIGDMRKSLSTPSFHDQETGLSLSSLWPTSKWNLKPDLQALSAAAIPKPILDGLPKQIAAWRNKTAVD